MLRNDRLGTGKSFFWSYLDSDINVESEIWTSLDLPVILRRVEYKKQQPKNE